MTDLAQKIADAVMAAWREWSCSATDERDWSQVAADAIRTALPVAQGEVVCTGIAFRSDCSVNGREVQSGTVFETAAPAAQGEAVAWRWSENSGKTWFDWRCDWTHHNSAEEKGFPIEYARIPAGQAASARIAELEREVERLREALEQYNRVRDSVGGCSDGACVVKRPTGMHTNGGCKCWKDNLTAQRMMRAGYQLAKAAEEALAAQEKNDE